MRLLIKIYPDYSYITFSVMNYRCFSLTLGLCWPLHTVKLIPPVEARNAAFQGENVIHTQSWPSPGHTTPHHRTFLSDSVTREKMSSSYSDISPVIKPFTISTFSLLTFITSELNNDTIIQYNIQ